MNTAEGLQMRQKILEFMRENDIAVCAETDRTTGTVHIEKLGNLESWDLFQQLVLYSDTDTLCDSTRSQFPFQVLGQGDTGCLLSWLDGGKAAALFFDCQLTGAAFTKWVRALDQKVRQMYKSEK